MNLKKVFACSALALSLVAGATNRQADAADLGLVTKGATSGCSDVVFVCENGRQYPLCPIAISVAGEIVTGTIQFSPRHAAYVRLVPLGVGYRYAGKNIWVDGVRSEAVMNFGLGTSVACTVSQL